MWDTQGRTAAVGEAPRRSAMSRAGVHGEEPDSIRNVPVPARILHCPGILLQPSGAKLVPAGGVRACPRERHMASIARLTLTRTGRVNSRIVGRPLHAQLLEGEVGGMPIRTIVFVVVTLGTAV